MRITAAGLVAKTAGLLAQVGIVAVVAEVRRLLVHLAPSSAKTHGGGVVFAHRRPVDRPVHFLVAGPTMDHRFLLYELECTAFQCTASVLDA